MDSHSISRLLFDEQYHSARWIAVEQEAFEAAGGDADAAIILFLHRVVSSEPSLRMELEEVARTCVRIVLVDELDRQGLVRGNILLTQRESVAAADRSRT